VVKDGLASKKREGEMMSDDDESNDGSDGEHRDSGMEIDENSDMELSDAEESDSSSAEEDSEVEEKKRKPVSPLQEIMKEVQRIAKHFKKVTASYEKFIDAQEAELKETKLKLKEDLDASIDERRNCEGDEKRSNLLTLKIDDLEGQLASVNRMKGLHFKLNVVTRWSSALNMIKRAIILRSHGEKILLDSDKSAVRSLVLPEQKWTILKEIVVLFFSHLKT
jgi:cobalamin biosynthesis protein CobT